MQPSAKVGDAAIADKAEAYIDARFDILGEDAKKAGTADPFAAVVKDGVTQQDSNSTNAAHKAMTDHLTSAWMSHNQKGAA